MPEVVKLLTTDCIPVTSVIVTLIDNKEDYTVHIVLVPDCLISKPTGSDINLM